MVNTRIKSRTLIAVIVMLVLFVSAGLSACSSTSSTSPSQTTASGNSVTIVNFSFSPAIINIKAGDTVTWTNNGTTTHTVTSDDGIFSSGNLAPGASFSFTFNNTGTFNYHCSIHTSMQAIVKVQ